MDKGAWQAKVHRVAESTTTKIAFLQFKLFRYTK